MKSGPITRIEAAAVRDAAGVNAAPGVVLIQNGRILAAGSPEKVGQSKSDQTRVLDRRSELVMPALVNAHAHLDLTHLPAPPPEARPDGSDAGFIKWVRHVIAERPTGYDAVAAAVRDGLTRSWEQGVGTIGDIAGSLDAVIARQELAAESLPSDDQAMGQGFPAAGVLPGVSYLELLGRGDAGTQAVHAARDQLGQLDFEVPVPGHDRGIVLGLAPHAPYSCDQQMLRQAVKLAQQKFYRLCMHLAESRAELEFVRDGGGPFRDLLERMGKDATPSKKDLADDPVAWINPVLGKARWAVVHGNHVAERRFATLARKGVCVVYCPAASEYFGEPRASDGASMPHPYRAMLDAGITVALGTDSPAGQPDDETQPLSVWAQMRRLRQRDGTAPGQLLTMATTYGLQALELPDDAASLTRGAPAALITAPVADRPADADPLTHALDHCPAVSPLTFND